VCVCVCVCVCLFVFFIHHAMIDLQKIKKKKKEN
jgi:hypothetical protein